MAARRLLTAVVGAVALAGLLAGCEKPTSTSSASPPSTFARERATRATERQHAPTTSPAPAMSTTDAPTPSVPAGDDTTIDHVVDGDTVWVADHVKVRFIGIDTPETVDPRKPLQCFGAEASARTKSLLPAGERVRLVYDAERLDRYGRTLAYVYRLSDGLFVNASLVRDGYASAYTVPPNVAHADEFVQLQREARDANRGLWGACPVDDGAAASSSSAPTPAPVPPPAPAPFVAAPPPGGNCDPSYPDVCIPPAPPDLDCGDISYRRFRVLAPDPHRFDADHDGVGCESG